MGNGRKKSEAARHPAAVAALNAVSGITGLLVLALVVYPAWPLWLRLGLIALFAAFHVLPLLRRHVSIFCRCLLPLLIGAICVEGYILLHEWEPGRDLMKYFRFHEAYNETFYSAIATLYAIITALALVKGIEDFDEIKTNITDEVYRLSMIDEMSRYFDASDGARAREAVFGLRRQIMLYADNAASFRDQTMRSENLQVLRDCQRQIASLTPEDANDQNSLTAMMAAHGELGVLRAKRIAAIGDAMPGYLIIALWVMALGMILPFMAPPPFGETGLGELRFGQYYIIFLMGALNSFLLLMLADISNPFDGFWQVNMTGFQELVAVLETELAVSAPERACVAAKT